MATTTVIPPQEQELRQEALTLVDRAKTLTVVDQASYDQACAVLTQQIIPARKRWKEFWYGSESSPGPVKLAHSTWKSLMDKFNMADEKLEQAEKTIKANIGRWEEEQRRIQAEAQRKAQEEAERKAREEADRESLFAELAGASAEEVQAIAEAPVAVIAPPVEPVFERASGVSTRSKWVAVVTDLKKLAAAIGKGQAPTTLITPNQSALNARATSDKNLLNIPGVIAKEERVVAGRSR